MKQKILSGLHRRMVWLLIINKFSKILSIEAIVELSFQMHNQGLLLKYKEQNVMKYSKVLLSTENSA